ncbi:unnamed protein product [Arctia plantaginis]|uniref:Uncharacterized protein n=1 Tax=Arctia plantaginis TaxID=874455 RepID=A0A8S1AHM2_ARCPL|nr:unnamed protein product [Arctia plantaginis]
MVVPENSVPKIQDFYVKCKANGDYEPDVWIKYLCCVKKRVDIVIDNNNLLCDSYLTESCATFLKTIIIYDDSCGDEIRILINI